MKKTTNKRKFNPDGSYTGKPTDTFEQPIQDADDL